MSSPRQITISQVAQAAEVAVGTVSRVLNGATDVNPTLRSHVLKMAKELNYVRLRRGRIPQPIPRSCAIGAVFFGMEDALVQLPVVSSALHGVEIETSEKERSLMFASIPKADRVPPFLRDSTIAGLIVKGPNQGVLPDPTQHPLVRAILSIPHVWLMGRPEGTPGDHCNFDTTAAGRLAARHLNEKGHTNIAFLNPKPGQFQFESLKFSFLAEAEQLGATASLLESDTAPDVTLPLPAITRQENVDALTERWSKIPAKKRPTALFVPSDRAAVQLYSALAARGLHVPHDVSIISCNNERTLLEGLTPALTTIDVHAELVGRRAVDLLLWRVANPADPVFSQLLIEPALIERASVAQL